MLRLCVSLPFHCLNWNKLLYIVVMFDTIDAPTTINCYQPMGNCPVAINKKNKTKTNRKRGDMAIASKGAASSE